VSATDPDLPPYNIRTFDEIRASYVAERRFAMAVMLAFAGLTAVLSTVGLYGVMSYLVQLRTREIGIRVAIGATPAEVLREVMRGGIVYALIGITAGCAAAGAASRVFISRIAGLQEVDPLTLTLSAGAMLLIALATAWLPARRAGRIDPVIALRSE
jgi:ABC-type antimicrobial peptide transport system permease subunit